MGHVARALKHLAVIDRVVAVNELSSYVKGCLEHHKKKILGRSHDPRDSSKCLPRHHESWAWLQLEAKKFNKNAHNGWRVLVE